eukprot:g2400.t1
MAQTGRVRVATIVTSAYAAFSFLSMRKEWVRRYFPDGALKRAILGWGEMCEASPAAANGRSLSTALVLMWLESVRTTNVSIVDIFWGLSFVISSWTYATHPKAKDRFGGRKTLILSLVSAWGARLSSYLLWRNHMSVSNGMGATGSLEDFRYQKFRRYYDRRGLSYWWFSLVQVFALQGVLSHVVSSSVREGMTNAQPNRFTSLDVVGTLTWIVGYFFEHVGDLDLVAFRSNPSNRSKVLSSGLWAHTRHPNYFGNSMMWWGIYLICCNAQGGWKSVYAPALMTYLLTDVSGSKLLERSLGKRKAGFAQYVKMVPEFVPWKLLSSAFA